MMREKYRAYPDGDDTGISWLREIPIHWKLNRFKNIFKIKKRIAGKLGFDILSITQRGVKIKDTESGDGQLSMDYSKYQMVFKNDFAMNHMDLLTGFVDISQYDGVTSPDYRVFTLEHDECFDRYFLYLLQMCYTDKIFYPLGQGASTLGRWRLPTEAFDEFVAPIPPQNEQQIIAAFLDHETAKIDTLIEKQQQLIKLLKEKRQAVISHAVTKGLNPNAPMRDSGVEWLGEVPAHWVVTSMKHLVSAPIIDGPHLSPVKQNEGIPFISAEAISQGYVNFEKKWGYISKEDHRLFSKRYCPKKGDILMVKLGATTGVVAMVDTDDEFNVWVPIATIRIHEGFPSKFVFYFLQSSCAKDAIQLSWTYGTQQTLGLGTIANLKLPLPPSEEAEKIVELIESKIPLYDESIRVGEESLLLLQERRTALISAAVTGKIDVRNWQPPEQNQANKDVAA